MREVVALYTDASVGIQPHTWGVAGMIRTRHATYRFSDGGTTPLHTHLAELSVMVHGLERVAAMFPGAKVFAYSDFSLLQNLLGKAFKQRAGCRPFQDRAKEIVSRAGLEVEMCWIKSHANNSGFHHLCNDWCDAESRAQMLAARMRLATPRLSA